MVGRTDCLSSLMAAATNMPVSAIWWTFLAWPSGFL